MSTFATSNLCCVVQQTVFCSLPRVGKRPFFGAHSIAGNGHTKNHQCKRSTSILYRGNNKKKILHFFFPGDHHGSDVFSVLSFYCA